MAEESSAAASDDSSEHGPPAPAWRVLGRRRRANVSGGRLHEHRVKVTPEEEAVLVRLAAVQDVTVARLLVESAMAPRGETASQRREAIVELFAVRRALAGVANNLNQLARHANAGEDFPPEARVVLARVKVLAGRLEDAVDRVARP